MTRVEMRMRKVFIKLSLIFLLLSSVLGESGDQIPRTPTPQYTFKIIHVFPHDSTAFTQGLAYRDGFLYEGTGLYGHSSIRKIRLETGKIVEHVDLPAEFFGEGIALHGKKILQLTWQSEKGFVYDLEGLHFLSEFSYAGEGWGLTTNGSEILLSDGTDKIRVLDGDTFRVKRWLRVHDGSSAITQLNELEMVEGEILANVWHTDRIARISPRDGTVTGWIDLTGLLSAAYRMDPEAVLNGIAYDPVRKRLFVTGKRWPSLFEIQVVPKTTFRKSSR
jgi:glutaminyl-peptide cyclotransferase